MKKYIKGIIDIGTNSCRLFLAEVEEKNNKIEILKKIYKETRITKLGNFIQSDTSIAKEGIDKLISIIKYFKNISDELKCEKIIGFATSAIRESKNKEEIIKEILDTTEVEVRVISGSQEGEMTFAGTSTEFKDDILLMDIGGGSTEFIYGNGNKIEYVKSFKVGAVRETKKFFLNDDYRKLEECRESVIERIGEIEKFRGRDFVFVGVAGTVTTNVSVYEKMKEYDSDKVHLFTLTKEMLEENMKKYLSLNLEERMKMIGLQPERGENIIAGTTIILEVMEMLNLDRIVVSECDGLEGAMINLK
ncbi:Ppx/GppA family phosphatase [Fusobacterium sp.]|uniref:Ppx/GppA phosphatase family protein n=1 Tax=Fusobacterium sp. TaxID=68766 RepID=UPI002608C77C|nr:Ppx/GppA family phosphatase [Fusobacterium sp.]